MWRGQLRQHLGGLHADNMKINAQNEELINLRKIKV
jgi:hypothetical protein